MTIDAQIRLAPQLIPRPPHKPYRYRTRVSDTCAHGIDYPHRVVAEAALGRPLQAGETVAHMDRDAENISPENLIVFRTRADFARWQRTGIFERRVTTPIAPRTVIKPTDPVTSRSQRCCDCWFGPFPPLRLPGYMG